VERKWWTLLAGCIAIFTLLLDVTIVNVALSPIERTLGADLSDLQGDRRLSADPRGRAAGGGVAGGPHARTQLVATPAEPGPV
jgi:hypothetical protein